MGAWLVTKQSKHEELLFDLDFHKTFCRLHHEANEIGSAFTARVAAALGDASRSEQLLTLTLTLTVTRTPTLTLT